MPSLSLLNGLALNSAGNWEFSETIPTSTAPFVQGARLFFFTSQDRAPVRTKLLLASDIFMLFRSDTAVVIIIVVKHGVLVKLIRCYYGRAIKVTQPVSTSLTVIF